MNKTEVASAARLRSRVLRPVPISSVLKICADAYDWLPGARVDADMRTSHGVGNELAVHLLDVEAEQAGSLFDSPGTLLLDAPELCLSVLPDPPRPGLVAL